MDSLDCRSPTRCRACVHSDARGACALEADLNEALAAMARPRFVPTLVDSRRAGLASA